MLAALSERDLDALEGMLDPEVEIHTQRGVRRGQEEALQWAARRFDHLQRRYEVEETHEAGDTVVALARVQYVWRESGEVGEEWLIGIVLDFADGGLRRWRLYEEPMDALEELEL